MFWGNTPPPRGGQLVPSGNPSQRNNYYGECKARRVFVVLESRFPCVAIPDATCAERCPSRPPKPSTKRLTDLYQPVS